MTRAWDASLLDRYQFRQSQTALTAYWLQQDGFQPAYPLPIFGPPWSVPFEFPLYQWIVALLANATGLSLLSAARLVGIGFFLLGLPAVYGLAAGAESNPRRRLLVPAAVLVAPRVPLLFAVVHDRVLRRRAGGVVLTPTSATCSAPTGAGRR